MKKWKFDVSLITSTILYLIAYVLICMGVCAARQWPIIFGVLVGIGLYILAVALVVVLTEVIMAIFNKLQPTIDDEVKSRFDEDN